MCVLLFDVFNGCSLVKKSIGKGMSNIYYWEKLTFSNLVGKLNWRNALALKSKKVYSGKRLFWHYCLQLSFVYKTVSQTFLICFAWDIKGFYQSFLGNKADFWDIMKVSPNILAKN